MKLRFGLDMDGVIYDFHSAFRFLANHEFGLDMPSVDEIWDRWDGHLRYMTREQDDWMWKEGIKRGLFRHGHVRRGAIEFCRELATTCDIVIITHRPIAARLDTLDWLAFNRIPITELHLLSGGENKARVPVDFALDDKPGNVFDFLAAGVKAKLWHRPWNLDVIHIPAAYSWEGVLNWVRDEREEIQSSTHS